MLDPLDFSVAPLDFSLDPEPEFDDAELFSVAFSVLFSEPFSELFAEPFDADLAASRLSVR